MEVLWKPCCCPNSSETTMVLFLCLSVDRTAFFLSNPARGYYSWKLKKKKKTMAFIIHFLLVHFMFGLASAVMFVLILLYKPSSRLPSQSFPFSLAFAKLKYTHAQGKQSDAACYSIVYLSRRWMSKPATLIMRMYWKNLYHTYTHNDVKYRKGNWDLECSTDQNMSLDIAIFVFVLLSLTPRAL